MVLVFRVKFRRQLALIIDQELLIQLNLLLLFFPRSFVLYPNLTQLEIIHFCVLLLLFLILAHLEIRIIHVNWISIALLFEQVEGNHAAAVPVHIEGVEVPVILLRGSFKEAVDFVFFALDLVFYSVQHLCVLEENLGGLLCPHIDHESLVCLRLHTQHMALVGELFVLETLFLRN